MNDQNCFLGNQLIVLSKNDLEVLIKRAALSITAEQAMHDAENDSDKIIDGEQYIDRNAAAKLLHVSLYTLWRWDKQGIIRSKKVGGRRILYKYSDIVNAIESEKEHNA